MANENYSTKICSTCKREHPKTDVYFFNRVSSADGLSNECKVCYYARRKNKFKDEPCPICGGQVPARNGKYCSHKCKGIARLGTERPDIKGKPAWNRGLTAKTSESVRKVSDAKLKNVVDAETLQQLYVEQNLTLREIGKMYDVTHAVISRLADEFGLNRKRELLTEELVIRLYESGMSFIDIGIEYNCSPAYVNQNFGQSIEARRFHGKDGSRMPFETRDGRIVTKDMLYELYVVEWLPYQEIAKILNVDFSTIPYWLKKLDIPRRTIWGTRRGENWIEPDADTIIHLYQADNLGMIEIGKMFGVSTTYIEKLLRENDISIRKSGYPNINHYIAKDGHKVRSGLELQVDNWFYANNIFHLCEPKLPNSRYRADFLVGDIYIEVWGLIGNKKYEEKMLKKLEVYEREGLKLLSIYPDDFPNLEVLAKYFRNLNP